MNKNIIIAGAIAIGFYILSQPKKITAIAQKVAQRTRSTTTPAIRQRTAQKIAQKVAQKVNISKLPVQRIRYMIAHAAALKKTGKEVAALRAEEARRVVAWKAAVRKATAQKIGKK